MSVIAEKIHLIEFFTVNHDVTVRLLDKIIHCLMEDERKKLSMLRKKLKEFEARYKFSTIEFQQRFNSGELGDEMDFFEWDAIADMAERLSKKLSSMKDIDYA